MIYLKLYETFQNERNFDKNVDDRSLNEKNLTKVIKKLSKDYNCTVEEINNGECDDFAVKVAEFFFDNDTAQTLFYRELNGFRLVTYTDYSKFTDELEPHTWIVYRGKHYDSEVPNGVLSQYELPIYKRQFNKKLNETYSADKEEIVDFIESLPNEIILYRGLIIEKGDNIDKENLGINWTLDEYFARNIFEYESFGGGGYGIEDYDVWVVTAMFNKSDIDYDGTIDKRLIKDKGFFWDELTGEMIENDNMDHHPYSHEDEILIKKNSTPKIINIEKI